MALPTGQKLAHYEIVDRLGHGGMGEVYLAHDTKLDRDVALKLLPSEVADNADSRARLQREAMALAGLNHPNIVHVYSVEEADGVHFITMELVQGKTLAELQPDNGFGPDEFLEIAIPLVKAIVAAHEKGIVHRDLKPANIMVSANKVVKVLDFGLARHDQARSVDIGSESPTAFKTQDGMLVGTLHYMSPEQALGQPVDVRSDLFSLGVLSYEMTTGAKPFDGETPAALFDAILHRAPIPARRLNEELPRKLEQIINKLLEKDPGARFQSAEELSMALEHSRVAVPSSAVVERLRNPWWTVAALAAGAVVSISLFGMVRRSAEARWARQEALPEIARLVEEEEFTSAFALAVETEAYVPEDPVLQDLWVDFSRRVSVKTDPAGADVSYAPYGAPAETWGHLGTTPIDAARIPRGFFRWKLEKDGYETVETANFPWLAANNVVMSRTLTKQGELAPGMVKVEGKEYRFDHPQLDAEERIDFDTYWLDRYEVTNRQYKQLVDAGGYRETGYWKHDFVKDGDVLSFRGAMAELVDSTGRPGPSTWEAGAFPEGADEYPVSGVSWYEAAAYCEFVGKRLPTLDHWDRAASILLSDYILPTSNFSGSATAPVGSYQSLGPEGTYDMAGNVKEWGWNESDGGRIILGGGWDEPMYMFQELDVQLPFRRDASYGFRCMKAFDEIPEALTGPIERYAGRDFMNETPISDEVFESHRRVFAYDRTDLNARVELRDDRAEYWVMERVSFDAAYGDERISAYLYLPKGSQPPYQTVVYFPSSGSIHRRSSEDLVNGPSGSQSGTTEGGGLGGIDFLVKSGRAVLYPIYKGTYERRGQLESDAPDATVLYRDYVVMWTKDLRRSVDYVETRPEFGGQIAFYGFSWGGGLVPPAIEDRLDAVILVSAALYGEDALPEVDQVAYAPRLTVPTLILNGRFDPWCPVETCQRPMFDLLGASEQDKRHVVFETGHTVPRRAAIKEILDWLDKFLGPVL